uniref:Uncharacterized protein n=1 Tax=Dunaliella tertiolecta TaxID=3047 RepID=A0A7S3VHF6_DUNTE
MRTEGSKPRQTIPTQLYFRPFFFLLLPPDPEAGADEPALPAPSASAELAPCLCPGPKGGMARMFMGMGPFLSRKGVLGTCWANLRSNFCLLVISGSMNVPSPFFI